MKNEKKRKPKLSAHSKIILKAARAAVRAAVLEHRRYGVPLIVFKDGKTVKMDPNKVKL